MAGSSIILEASVSVAGKAPYSPPLKNSAELGQLCTQLYDIPTPGCWLPPALG